MGILFAIFVGLVVFFIANFFIAAGAAALLGLLAGALTVYGNRSRD